MAFVNERMTQEEKANFAARGIRNPGNRLSTLKPCQWTINREDNVFLVWGLQEREEPHDNYFLLSWKGELVIFSDGLLVLDRDANGFIDGGKELFEHKDKNCLHALEHIRQFFYLRFYSFRSNQLKNRLNDFIRKIQ